MKQRKQFQPTKEHEYLGSFTDCLDDGHAKQSGKHTPLHNNALLGEVPKKNPNRVITRAKD